jgi:hypothetical protein
MGSFFLWEKQNARVCDMMREVRSTLSAGRDWTLLFQARPRAEPCGVVWAFAGGSSVGCARARPTSSVWGQQDRGVSEALKRHYRRIPKKQLRVRETCKNSLLKQLAERAARRRGLRPGACGKFDARECAAMARAATALHQPEDLLQVMGYGPAASACAALREEAERAAATSKGRAFALMQAPLADRDVERIHDAVAAALHARSVFVVNLPAEFAGAQARAVARRMGCAPEDWAVLRRVTRVFICPACHKLKNFSIGAKDSRTSAKARACGYEKVVHPSPLGEEDRALSCANTDACRVHTLAEYDILRPEGGRVAGGVLQTPQTCITVSPCCGMLVYHGSVRATGAAGGYTCSGCSDAGGV